MEISRKRWKREEGEAGEEKEMRNVERKQR